MGLLAERIGKKGMLCVIAFFGIGMFFLFSGVGMVQGEGKQSSDIEITYAERVSKENIWPNDQLKDRFVAYWVSRFSGNTATSLKIEAPYFQDMANVNRYRMYIGQGNGELKGIKFLEREQRTERLHFIRCTIRFVNPGGREMETTLGEEWVYVGGQWFHIFRDRLLFPELS